MMKGMGMPWPHGHSSPLTGRSGLTFVAFMAGAFFLSALWFSRQGSVVVEVQEDSMTAADQGSAVAGDALSMEIEEEHVLPQQRLQPAPGGQTSTHVAATGASTTSLGQQQQQQQQQPVEQIQPGFSEEGPGQLEEETSAAATGQQQQQQQLQGAAAAAAAVQGAAAGSDAEASDNTATAAAHRTGGGAGTVGGGGTAGLHKEGHAGGRAHATALSPELEFPLCESEGVDFIPCLDNAEAIAALKTTSHYEHRERHCPSRDRVLRCLLPLPPGYRPHINWPESRDQIWYANVPHPSLASYKADQNWVKADADKFVFPGGGTQFKNGATQYIEWIQQVAPDVAWGKRTAVAFDVGCGVGSWGAYLEPFDVRVMSMAPKDEHDAQIQFALERGVAAIVGVMGTMRQPYPANVYDVVHCARCRVPWHVDGGRLLLELNRLMRPGGYFVWSATPLCLECAAKEPDDKEVWEAMQVLMQSLCWSLVAKEMNAEWGIGVGVWQKPTDNQCYDARPADATPPLCPPTDRGDAAWYELMSGCIHRIPAVTEGGRGATWPEEGLARLTTAPAWLDEAAAAGAGQAGVASAQAFDLDTGKWVAAAKVYKESLNIDWSNVRNAMDMNAHLGGLAAALAALPVWVMNVVPTDAPDTLPVVFDRGLLGIYHDWCESFNTYPRTYDLLHADSLLGQISRDARCDVADVMVEMDRVLRPNGYVVVRESGPGAAGAAYIVGQVATKLHWEVLAQAMDVGEPNARVTVFQKTLWRPPPVSAGGDAAGQGTSSDSSSGAGTSSDGGINDSTSADGSGSGSEGSSNSSGSGDGGSSSDNASTDSGGDSNSSSVGDGQAAAELKTEATEAPDAQAEVVSQEAEAMKEQVLDEKEEQQQQQQQQGEGETEEGPETPQLAAPVTLPEGEVEEVMAEVTPGPGDTGAYAWPLCSPNMTDYIPCLDNAVALRQLKDRSHFQHRERHCPTPDQWTPCLVPLPDGYKDHITWPDSRDQIWYANVPHPKLVSYKADQRWVLQDGDKLLFPSGGTGTQFKHGATQYIDFMQQNVEEIAWGKHSRVMLDMGCGVASLSAYLEPYDVRVMSMAPNDEHEAQIQLALERGVLAVVGVMGTQRLPFPSNAYDVVHCARCRVPWHRDGGMLLLELNRVLRPGGYFLWSATPIYKDNKEDKEIWTAMDDLTRRMCWTLVAKANNPKQGVGAAFWKKPTDNTCFDQRPTDQQPPMCEADDNADAAWYVPMKACMHRVPSDSGRRATTWPVEGRDRLSTPPQWLASIDKGLFGAPMKHEFERDLQHWGHVVKFYERDVPIDWASVRNVMDMNARYGGFAAQLARLRRPLWVLSVIPVSGPDTLPVVFDRGLLGIYHDWCESFNTYPRTYDLLHADHALSQDHERCDVSLILLEMDRVLRPGGWAVIRDHTGMSPFVETVAKALHWNLKFSQSQDKEALYAFQKTRWRPDMPTGTDGASPSPTR